MNGGLSMSDMEVPFIDQAAGAASSGASSPGAMLKAARQALGVHIEALAVALKVPVSKLEALEADNYAVLPDAVFVRALASSVCRSLKMDPAPVLALMPQSSVPSLAADSAGINAAFKDGSEKGRTGAIVSRAMHPAFLGALVLLLGAAAILIFFPHTIPEQASAEGASVAGSTTETPAASPVAVGAEPASAALPVAQGKEPIAAPMSAPPAVQESVVVAPAQAPVAASVAESVPSDVGSELLAFRARSESWIQVRDASGATTLQRVVAAGEKVVAPGKPPFSVVVGKADATEVLVRGKVLDLVAVSKDNVARFEVKP